MRKRYDKKNQPAKIMKKLLKGLIVCMPALALACQGTTDVTGTWLQPVPGLPGTEQGFTLAADGRASSVGMATLQYETWRQEDDRLILTGKSIGNGQTIAFTDTFRIERLTADSLVLTKGTQPFAYGRAAGQE